MLNKHIQDDQSGNAKQNIMIGFRLSDSCKDGFVSDA
jgi:phosphoenolpyruvate carboxylase